MVEHMKEGTEDLHTWYEDAARCVTIILPHHREFFNMVWAFHWDTTPVNISAYLSFLVKLVSGHGGTYARRVLRTLVSTFKPAKLPLPLNAPADAEVEYDEEVMRPITEKAHHAIQQILHLFPGAEVYLAPVLTSSFPYHAHALPIQRYFCQQVLRVLQYCPGLRDQVLHTMVDKLLQIDVEIKLDDFLDDEEDEEDEEDMNDGAVDEGGDGEVGLFGMDIDTPAPVAAAENNEQNEFDPDDFSPEELEKMRHHQAMAMKLDVMMDMFLAHLTAASTADRRSYFKILLNIFDSLVLCTHRSKYTQFIMFHLCHLEPMFKSTFLTYLLSYTMPPPPALSAFLTNFPSQNHTPIPVVRQQSAIAYLASLCGRAVAVTGEDSRIVLESLVLWAHGYLAANSASLSSYAAPDAEKHALYHISLQAILYIFCFKFSEVISLPGSRQWTNELKLELLVQSPFNPLLFIHTQVAREFVNLAKSHQLPVGFACERILERNRLIVISTRSAYGGSNLLDSFFPFDPFLLKNSSRHFNDSYKMWTPSQDDDPEDDNGSAHHSDSEPVPIRVRPRGKSSAMQIAHSLEGGGGFSNSVESSFGSWGGDDSGGHGAFGLASPGQAYF